MSRGITPLLNPGLPQRHRDHGGNFLMIQSRDGDWIINSIPSGTETQTFYGALTRDEVCFLNGLKAVIWRVPPRQIKKLLLCALCDSVVKNLFWTRVTINKLCIFCGSNE